MSLIPLNPIPLYVTKAEGTEFENIQTELLEVSNNVEFEQIPHWDTFSHSLSKNAFGSNILSDYKCQDTIDFIKKSVDEYLNSINYRKPYNFRMNMNSAWITKTLKGHQAHPHNHPGSHISGCYYIKTNGKDGNLSFNNIHISLCDNPIIASSTQETAAPLEEGVLLLWPSPLVHGVKENKTDNERYSLSFNIEIQCQMYKEFFI